MPRSESHKAEGRARLSASTTGGGRRKASSRRGSRYLGFALLLGGLAILGYVGWTYFGTTAVAKHEQKESVAELKETWETASPAPATAPAPTVKPEPESTPVDPLSVEGVFALIRIERFGSDYEVPIVKGVDETALSKGVGWDTESTLPGKKGNFVLAGHRITHGEPFRQFPELEAGDEVVVETQEAIYTYVLENGGTDNIVDSSASWVTDPVPGEVRQAKPTEELVTLITCTDLFSSDRRSIVTGVLSSVEKK